MKFVVEIPDKEVLEAAQQPEDLAREIAEVIAREIFRLSSVTVVRQRRTDSRLGSSPSN